MDPRIDERGGQIGIRVAVVYKEDCPLEADKEENMFFYAGCVRSSLGVSMKKEIVNRIANSKLVTFDLEDYYPEGRRVLLDIKDWLHEGFILKEKEFRTFVSEHDWGQYEDSYVALHCSSDAIVPGWAYMLITTRLQPFAKRIVQGNLQLLETSIYQEVLDHLDLSEFTDKPVIIKGCSNKPVPPNAYLFITSRLQTVAKSVMYGEACSSVPLFKRK